MNNDQMCAHEAAHLAVRPAAADALVWKARVERHRWADPDGAILARLRAGAAFADLPAPDEVIERVGNLLMFGGASCLWQALIGNGTGTAGQALTFFNNANAAIGVGDSTAAAAATQTDLQAATNKDRNAMDATYPQHTDGTADANNDIVFRSSFGAAEANFAWQEWGVFNSPTAATGRMLNRKVESLGTKTTGTWTLTVTLTLA